MFENIFGHNRQKAILERQLERGSISHAYLFTGKSGIGKRTLAESFAIEIIKRGIIGDRLVTIEHADIILYGYDKNNIGIKDVRKIIEQISVRPLEGSNRVFIIDHAERINTIAQNALLKTIEEPQPGNVFILITENPSSLLETIQSRCQALPFKDISVSQKRELLEKLGISYTGDLTLSVGEIKRVAGSPERERQLKDYYTRFMRVLSGDSYEALLLAEDIAAESSEDREKLDEILLFLIRGLYQEMIRTGKNTIFALQILFDLYDKLSYNVNLRLQLEGSLVKISMEHKNGKEYSRR